MEIIFQKEWDYTFSKNEDNELIFSVLCGTVALFEYHVLLNQDEINQYNKQGKKFIEHLAQKIRNNPNQWTSKKV